MAMQMLNSLITEVENLDTSAESVVPTFEGDLAWCPEVPVGHTDFSWGEVGGSTRPVSTAASPSKVVPKVEAKNSASTRPVSTTASATKAVPKVEAKNAAAPAATPAETSTGEQKQGKKDKKAKKAKKPKVEAPVVPPFYRIDIRVGRILECKKHEGADSLYIESIDVGEETPRQVVSGLVKYVPLDKMINAPVMVITNLKPSNLKGVTSYGMVLAASAADGVTKELVVPPEGTPVGAQVFLEGEGSLREEYTADATVNPKKKNSPWRTVLPALTTDAQRRCCFDGKPMHVAQGVLVAPNLANATVS